MPISKPLCDIPEWESTEPEDQKLSDLEFFKNINNRKIDLLEFYSENYHDCKNKNKKKYLELIINLEIAREYLELRESFFYINDPEWNLKSESIAGIRYSLGRIITHFCDKIIDKKT